MSQISVAEAGQRLNFCFRDMLRFHGSGSPGGVAHAFKVLERTLPILSPGAPPERRDLTIHTPFEGPGARDAFELVTRAVSDGRYVIEPSLARPERGVGLERFVFRVGLGDRSVTVVARDGYATDEFILLARKPGKSAAEAERLRLMKLEVAELVMGSEAADVYELVEGP